MAARLHTLRKGAGNTMVGIYRDAEWNEWQVRIPGSPDATYHTDDKADALSTAEVMLRDLELRAVPTLERLQ